MIKKYVLIFLLLPLLTFAQDKFSLLDKSSMQTSILYDRVYQVANITDDTQKINALYFIQAYSELSKADYGTNFQNIETYKTASKIGFVNNYVPIGILHTEFDIVGTDAVQNGYVSLDANNNVIKNTTSAVQLFQTIERTFASPLTHNVKGLHTTFKILPDLITNTTDTEISSIQIDFNDNLGYRLVNMNQELNVNFENEGEKKIDFRITLNDGTIKENASFINVQMSSADYNARTVQGPGDESAITPINSSLTYQGFGETSAHLGTADYKIYYDNVDGVLDKPIFLVDGFDPSDSRTIPLIYDLMNYGMPIENLADDVRDLGFDIVIINFPTYVSASDGTTPISGGADFIQRNAYTLIELINTINGMKSGSEQNVIIGPSMGGLISRYALRYMEQNTMNHDTRLYISFDSPHLGANVPIGIQYMFNYMVNGDPGIVAAEPLVNGLLNSAAAKQMLIDHYLSHLQGGSIFLQDATKTLPVGAPDFRDTFQGELNAMGFPQDVRNVAITNGSGLSAQTGSPGMNLIDHTFDTGVVSGFNTRAIIKTYFTPRNVETITVTDFVGEAFIIVSWVEAFSFLATAESTSPTMNSGLDSAPGGQFDLYSFDDGTDPLITEFVANLNSQYFDFIPTLSGLSISTEPNWYAAPNTAQSPFVATHIPDVNEPHVTLTAANVAFALNEILNPPLSIPSFEESTFKLEKNPITNELSLLSSETHEGVTITIVDLTGKVIFDSFMTISNRTQIPINVDSGLYILNINSDDGFKFQTKLIVK